MVNWNACRTKDTIVLAITIPFVGLFVLSLVFIVSRLKRQHARLITLAKKYELEEYLQLNRGSQKFKYKDLSTATNGFSSDEVLGDTEFGSIFRGRLLPKGADRPIDVAVKRIPTDSQDGARELLTAVKIIGQVRHRNLVRLLGWCYEKSELLLVYDYMPNGSLDQHLFKNADASGEPVLTWARRLKIVGGVATALAHLHWECGKQVIHRDVKSSAIMIDRDFKVRLGDFGFAPSAKISKAAGSQSTVSLAGTYGYLAPEIAPTLKVTEKTDVYSFGVMMLEVGTGKRPVLSEEDKEKCNEPLLVDWVWSLHRDGTLLEAADWRLKNAFDPGEMTMFLKIGLLCCHPDPDQRPTMREVLNIWKGSSPVPSLPRSKPVPVFSLRFEAFDTALTIFPDDHGYSYEFGEQTPVPSESDGRRHRSLTTALKEDDDWIPQSQIPTRISGSQIMPTLTRCRSSRTSLPL